MRTLKLLTVAALIVPLLVGCWSYNDINRTTLVLSIGLDIVDEEYHISGEHASLHSGKSDESGGNGGGDPKVELFSGKGKDFEEARHAFRNQLTNPIFLGATGLILFGPKYAEKGIIPYINRIDKLPDYRKTAIVAISRETPSILFETGTKKSLGVGFLIEENLTMLKKRKAGLFITVGDVLSDIDMGLTGYLLPYFGLEEGEVKSLGYAAMKDSKLVGTISTEDAHGVIYLMVKGAKMNEIITMPGFEGEFGFINFENNIKDKKIKFDYRDGRLTINIELENKAVLEHQYYKHIVNKEMVNSLETLLSEKVETKVLEIITRSQTEFKADLFDFAKHFRAKHYREYMSIDWERAYIDAVVNVEVQTVITSLTLSDTEARSRR